MRKTLTDKGVAALKARLARYNFPDPELRGHYVRVQPTGAKTFAAVTVDPQGRQVWTSVGRADRIGIEEARTKARDALARVRKGLPALEAAPIQPTSFADVAGIYLKRHVEANGLISRREIERCIRKYVLPVWGDRAFIDIRRSDIAALLDLIQDEHGAWQADHVLAVVRGVSNWYATRHDDYASPFTRGMRRADPQARRRARILADDEIRALWAVTGTGQFGAILRLLLLTAQRREKLGAMRWSDVADGVWAIPTNDREKGTGGALKLPELALAIVRSQPLIGENPFVFAGRGSSGHVTAWSRGKREINARLPPMQSWVLHDLRRTARSLMARAGVRPDIAERVMGHVLGGVEGVYDRHSYFDEKADALRKLAALIENIVNPQENVVPLQRVVR